MAIDLHYISVKAVQKEPGRLFDYARICIMITLHYIKIIVRKCKALQSLNKIELRVVMMIY